MILLGTVTIMICWLCARYIISHEDNDDGLWIELLRNSDGLCFMFTLEIVFDLIVPAPYSIAGCPERFAVGFFGRWRSERNFYEPLHDAEAAKWGATADSEGQAPLLPKALRLSDLGSALGQAP